MFVQAEEHLIKIAKEKGWKKMQYGKQNMSEGLVSIVSSKNSAAIVEVTCLVLHTVQVH